MQIWTPQMICNQLQKDTIQVTSHVKIHLYILEQYG